MKLIFGFIFAIFIFATAPIFAGDPITDYAFAQKCYHTLDKTVSRGWDKCVKQFEQIVTAYPKSDQASKSLFSIGRLSQEKYNISHNDEDLQGAFKSLNEFVKTYPQDLMADDALYRIGSLRYEKQGDKAKAEKAMKAILERYPNGDMAKAAEEYLDKLNGIQTEKIPSFQIKKKGSVISASPDEEDAASIPEKVEALPSTAVKTPVSEMDFRIKTVAIDPGHGGEDPGAEGPDGTKEADIALQISRKVAFKLKNDLHLKPFLTRTKNKTLTLEERNLIANKKKADLFISIHANANDSPKPTGVQVFYLNNSTNQASKRLAARENKESKKPKNISEKILSTMLQNANTDDSRDLAKLVQTSLVTHLAKKYRAVKDLKVDSALFYVLVGAKSPSILVETSFITNPKEEKRLKDSQYQWEIAEGITNGIKKYIETRHKVATSL
ncbi:MAG: N-acetylmuramoyl-L-alanine amidase [Deltaproteobacteria bacterium]|nr:N-acetylmuramoyl-L-alanine amidase [Deltaproteobacteria bacterium]